MIICNYYKDLWWFIGGKSFFFFVKNVYFVVLRVVQLMRVSAKTTKRQIQDF